MGSLAPPRFLVVVCTLLSPDYYFVLRTSQRTLNLNGACAEAEVAASHAGNGRSFNIFQFAPHTGTLAL